MAKTYKIRALKTTMVDYLGVFAEGEERDLDQTTVDFYINSRGIPLTQENLPDTVELTVDGQDDAPTDSVKKAETDPSFPVKEA